MKPPDDIAARLARLRVEIVDAFMAGDMETWSQANAEAREILGTAKRRENFSARSRSAALKRFLKPKEQ
jgi:hypothetical protein